MNPDENAEPPPFFINADRGYIRLTSEHIARFESSTGDMVELRRIEGSIVLGGSD